MNITYKNAVKSAKKFQQGGPIETPEGAAPASESSEPVEGAPEGAAPEGQEDPMVQLVQIFSQGLQNQDCQALAQGAQMFLELVQQAQGSGQPQQPQGEPVFRKGGRLAYRLKK